MSAARLIVEIDKNLFEFSWGDISLSFFSSEAERARGHFISVKRRETDRGSNSSGHLGKEGERESSVGLVVQLVH